MQRLIKLKYLFFAHYWWLIVLALLLATGLLLERAETMSTMATVIGAILSMAYFLQKQKLEEMRLFREIFKECNERYEAMNEVLDEISQKEPSDLSAKERAQVINYLNLCGEEYLYFRQGYINPVVWTAWLNGMKFLMSHPSIKLIWDQEKKTGSYYDLPL